MSMFANLATDESIEEGKDFVGGGGFGPWESDIYLTEIQAAYVTKADSGAMAMNLVLKNDQGQEATFQFWMTSGTAKGGKNYYEKDGKKHFLPGFEQANHACLLTVGKEINELEPEEKVIKLYSNAAKATIPTKVPMVTELIGQKILAAVQKQTVDKTAKQDDDSYKPTGESRDQHEVIRFMRESDKKTVAEVKGSKDAEFHDGWLDKNKGKTYDKRKNKSGGTPGVPGATAAPAANSSKPQKSLFAA